MSHFDKLSLLDPSKIKEDNIFDNESNIFDNLPIDFLTKNLSELLLSNLSIPSYNLTSEQIIWINEFIKASPASFEKITSDIKSITSTNIIEAKNIPQIVKLCADVYYSGAINYNLVNASNIISFIKYTIDVILTTKLYILPDVEKEVIKELVDISLTLLSMNINKMEDKLNEIKTSKGLIGCLKIFKFK